MRPDLGGEVFNRQRDKKSRMDNGKESESSQVEENQNGLMARPLQSKLRCLRYKVLVRDQL